MEEGTWAADDLRRAFVACAAWWEYQTSRATMWGSDRNEAENEAERRYPAGRPGEPQTVRQLDGAGVEDDSDEDAGGT